LESLDFDHSLEKLRVNRVAAVVGQAIDEEEMIFEQVVFHPSFCLVNVAVKGSQCS
jgi:hypothetical protein